MIQNASEFCFLAEIRHRGPLLVMGMQLQDSIEKQQAMQQHISDADRQYRGMYDYMQAMHCQLQTAVHANHMLKQEIEGLKGGVLVSLPHGVGHPT